MVALNQEHKKNPQKSNNIFDLKMAYQYSMKRDKKVIIIKYMYFVR